MNIALTRDGLGYNLAIGTEEYSLQSAPQLIKKGTRLFMRVPGYGEQQLSGNNFTVEGVDVSAQDAATMRSTVNSLFFSPDELLFKLKQRFQGGYGCLTPLGGGGATLHILGLGNSVTGTATGRTYTNAAPATAYRRVGYVVAVAANNAQAGWRPNTASWQLSNSISRGGFLWITRFMNATQVSNPLAKLFVGFGLSAGLVSPTVEPSTFQSIATFACDSTDANIQFMHNDSAGDATKIDMGPAFPKNTFNADIYECAIWAFRNRYAVGYMIRNKITGKFRVGEVNTNIPGATSGLAWQVTLSSGDNGGAPVAPEIDLVDATEVFYP